MPVGAPEDPRTAALQRSNRELALQNGRLVEQVGQLAAENASLTHMSSCLAATRRVREEEQVREAAKLQQDLRQAGEERRALRAELAARQVGRLFTQTITCVDTTVLGDSMNASKNRHRRLSSTWRRRCARPSSS